MSTATTAAPQDRFVRISADQVLCANTGCGKAASIVLHRFMGSGKPARLAYCDHHASQIASNLHIHIPERATATP